jgi:hypothetical protein
VVVQRVTVDQVRSYYRGGYIQQCSGELEGPGT